MARKPAPKKRAARPRKEASGRRSVHSKDQDDLCPIVRIGGSAGGFEATMELLQELPSKNGLAFAVVQHLDPHHASKLASLLGRATSMPVMEVEKTLEIQPHPSAEQKNYCEGIVAPDGLR